MGKSVQSYGLKTLSGSSHVNGDYMCLHTIDKIEIGGVDGDPISWVLKV